MNKSLLALKTSSVENITVTVAALNYIDDGAIFEARNVLISYVDKKLVNIGNMKTTGGKYSDDDFYYICEFMTWALKNRGQRTIRHLSEVENHLMTECKNKSKSAFSY